VRSVVAVPSVLKLKPNSEPAIAAVERATAKRARKAAGPLRSRMQPSTRSETTAPGRRPPRSGHPERRGCIGPG
jgi:hypothetical protein